MNNGHRITVVIEASLDNQHQHDIALTTLRSYLVAWESETGSSFPNGKIAIVVDGKPL